MPEDTKGGEKLESSTSEIKGQESDSPTDTDAGSKKSSETPAEEAQDFIEQDGKKFYAAFDKHPEWRGLKEAKTALDEILEENGYESLADLDKDLRRGLDLNDLLNGQDVESLVDAANKWHAAEEYWAEQEAKKLEEGETLEETNKRLKEELKAERANRQSTEEDQEILKEQTRALYDFETAVGKAVDEQELPTAEKSLLKLFLGVDNQMDDVDLTDKKAVRTAIKDGTGQFVELISAIKQSAIDGYVKGKSEIKATPPTETGAEKTHASTIDDYKIPENATVDEAFADMGRLIKERIVGTLKATE